jgi:hypothetical protein
MSPARRRAAGYHWELDRDHAGAEQRLAQPIYRGRLTRGPSCSFLFQGSAGLLFGGESSVSAKLRSIFVRS